MSQLTYNQWQAHIAKQLQENYVKLKLVKTDERNIRAVPAKKS
jgi:hypothetical protein